jgi:hypothetical protein
MGREIVRGSSGVSGCLIFLYVFSIGHGSYSAQLSLLTLAPSVSKGEQHVRALWSGSSTKEHHSGEHLLDVAAQ